MQTRTRIPEIITHQQQIRRSLVPFGVIIGAVAIAAVLLAL